MVQFLLFPEAPVIALFEQTASQQRVIFPLLHPDINESITLSSIKDAREFISLLAEKSVQQCQVFVSTEEGSRFVDLDDLTTPLPFVSALSDWDGSEAAVDWSEVNPEQFFNVRESLLVDLVSQLAQSVSTTPNDITTPPVAQEPSTMVTRRQRKRRTVPAPSSSQPVVPAQQQSATHKQSQANKKNLEQVALSHAQIKTRLTMILEKQARVTTQAHSTNNSTPERDTQPLIMEIKPMESQAKKKRKASSSQTTSDVKRQRRHPPMPYEEILKKTYEARVSYITHAEYHVRQQLINQGKSIKETFNLPIHQFVTIDCLDVYEYYVKHYWKKHIMGKDIENNPYHSDPAAAWAHLLPKSAPLKVPDASAESETQNNAGASGKRNKGKRNKGKTSTTKTITTVNKPDSVHYFKNSFELYLQGKNCVNKELREQIKAAKTVTHKSSSGTDHKGDVETRYMIEILTLADENNPERCYYHEMAHYTARVTSSDMARIYVRNRDTESSSIALPSRPIEEWTQENCGKWFEFSDRFHSQSVCDERDPVLAEVLGIEYGNRDDVTCIFENHKGERTKPLVIVRSHLCCNRKYADIIAAYEHEQDKLNGLLA